MIRTGGRNRQFRGKKKIKGKKSIFFLAKSKQMSLGLLAVSASTEAKDSVEGALDLK